MSTNERLYIMPKSSKEAVTRLNERAAFIADKVRVTEPVEAIHSFLGWSNMTRENAPVPTSSLGRHESPEPDKCQDPRHGVEWDTLGQPAPCARCRPRAAESARVYRAARARRPS